MSSRLIRMYVIAGVATLLALTLIAPNATARERADTNSSQGSVLEEVVVTAQKRGVQNLQDVPVSMTVMSGIRLDASSYEGVNNAIASMPGVTLYDTAQTGGSRVTMRGVAPAAAITSGSSTSAYYLDQMPFGFSELSITPDANPYDLERVEVLKGPQGTLYGAAALGGVVRVLTQDANLDEFEFKGRADLSSTRDGDESYRGDLAVNTPIVPGKLAVRGVIGYQDKSGWIDSPVEDNVNDAEIQTARIKVGARPIENLRVDFSAWFSRDDRDMMDASLEDRTTPNDVKQPIETDYDLYGLTLEYEIDSISLISSSTYMDYFNIGTMQIVPGLPLEFDLGGGALNFLTTELQNELFAQEIRLFSHTGGPWNWSIGGFYRDTKEFRASSGVLSPAGVSSNVIRSEQLAFFGELTRAFFDGEVEVTAGLRYFNDDVEWEELSSGVPLNPGESLRMETDSFDEVTSRVVLSWYAKRNLTAYVSFGEGFRSGVLQDSRVVENLPNAQPDVLTNYEIGAKGTAANGRVRYDIALYYLDWEDVQQSLRFLPEGGGQDVPFTATSNAGDASGLGVDAGIDITVTDNLTIHGSFGWNDLTFDQDIRDDAGTIIFAEDSRLDQSAEWSGNARLDYRFPIGATGYEGRFSAAVNFSDSLDIRNPVGEIARADSIVNSSLNLAVSSPSSKLSYTFYVDNLNDEDGIVAILDEVFPNFNTRLRPRTYGVRVSYQH